MSRLDQGWRRASCPRPPSRAGGQCAARRSRGHQWPRGSARGRMHRPPVAPRIGGPHWLVWFSPSVSTWLSKSARPFRASSPSAGCITWRNACSKRPRARPKTTPLYASSSVSDLTRQRDLVDRRPRPGQHGPLHPQEPRARAAVGPPGDVEACVLVPVERLLHT